MVKKVNVLLSGVIALVAMCGQSFAGGSGAYRLDVPDARALSMGGAFVAVADSPAAVFYNQAGMTQLSQSEASVGMALIQPKANAVPDSGNKTKMQRDSFFVPTISSVTRLSEKLALGVGATSSWGLGTEWAQDSFARYVSTRTKLQNQDYLLSVAYKLNDKLSLGTGLMIDNSTIEKEKKICYLGGAADGNLKLQGDNVAAGFQVSAFYQLNERHQFGAQYSSDIRRKYHGKVFLNEMDDALNGTIYLSGAGNTSFGSSYETDVVSKATLPQSVDLGYSYMPSDKLTLSANVVWTDWGSTKKDEVAFPNETGYNLAFLNTGNPTNRDWHGAISVGLGTEYLASDRLRLRCGYYFHQTPVEEATFDTSMPDSNSHSGAMGFGYDVTKSLTWDLTYSAMFFDDRSINNKQGDAIGYPIDGKYRQWINLVSTTITYKF